MSVQKKGNAIPLDKWRSFIDALSDGAKQEEALFDAAIPSTQFEQSLRDSAEKQVEYEEARTRAIRAHWSASQLEHIMDSVVRGDKGGSLEKIVGKNEIVSFLRLIERDPGVSSMYAEARLLWAEKKVDDLVEIINTEEKLDKAKFDAAKWLMSTMNDKFSTARKANTEKDNTEDLVIKLEAGRKRVEDLWAEREAAGEDMSVFG